MARLWVLSLMMAIGNPIMPPITWEIPLRCDIQSVVTPFLPMAIHKLLPIWMALIPILLTQLFKLFSHCVQVRNPNRRSHRVQYVSDRNVIAWQGEVLRLPVTDGRGKNKMTAIPLGLLKTNLTKPCFMCNVNALNLIIARSL